MFETTKIVLTENTRSLIKKLKDAPFLYLMFSGMIIFSIVIFSFAAYFLINIETSLDISISDVFFIIFFIFFLKTVADFYNNFTKSHLVTYSLSTQVSQKRTAFEIFFAILLTELIIWFSFSLMFLFTLSIFRININYPFEYLLFTIGIITASCIGCAVSINFFSSKKYRLLPMLILLGFYFYVNHPLFVVFTLPIAVIHCAWSIKNSMDSYLFSKRKERTKERSLIKIQGTIKAQFHRETTVLWRDKLLLSFIFTSVTTGLFSGYFFLYGDEILIPEALRETLGGFLPSMFLFLGIYVVVMYTAVFPALNLFLNEEKTMWIIRYLPVKNDTVIYGKVSALALCFLTTIPFIPYISIFTGLDRLGFLLWFLVFSYIAGVIISVPLGVKYVGKKSDILLLYSVSIILFLVLGLMVSFINLIEKFYPYPIIFYLIILVFEIFILYFSLKASSQILALKYKSAKNYS